MLADFYIPRLSHDMKIAVQKNNLGGQIWYRSLDPVKNGVIMRLCDKHIPAKMSIGTFRQNYSNQFSIHCYIFVRNVTIGNFWTEYACHILWCHNLSRVKFPPQYISDLSVFYILYISHNPSV